MTKATDSLNREVFTALGLAAEDLDVLNDVLRRFRKAHGDYDEA